MGTLLYRHARTFTHMRVYTCIYLSFLEHVYVYIRLCQSQTSLKMYFIQFECSSVPSFFLSCLWACPYSNQEIHSALTTAAVAMCMVCVCLLLLLPLFITVSFLWYSGFCYGCYYYHHHHHAFTYAWPVVPYALFFVIMRCHTHTHTIHSWAQTQPEPMSAVISYAAVQCMYVYKHKLYFKRTSNYM